VLLFVFHLGEETLKCAQGALKLSDFQYYVIRRAHDKTVVTGLSASLLFFSPSA
jgi:homogentisate 1,2-dioxygenase